MTRVRYRLCIWCGILGVLLAWLFLGSVPPASAQEKGNVSFINDVAPILKEYCFACHDTKKRSGKYDMTTFEKLFAGGSSGDPVTAGKSADSDFYTLLVTTEERRMPPRKDNLSPVPKAKAEVIKKWTSTRRSSTPSPSRRTTNRSSPGATTN
jgi:hypothetical protein